MGGKAQKAKQVKLPNGELGVEYYDADGNKLVTNAGGKKPWRNNNPGNLKGGSGAIGYDEKGFAILTAMHVRNGFPDTKKASLGLTCPKTSTKI